MSFLLLGKVPRAPGLMLSLCYVTSAGNGTALEWGVSHQQPFPVVLRSCCINLRTLRGFLGKKQAAGLRHARGTARQIRCGLRVLSRPPGGSARKAAGAMSRAG